MLVNIILISNKDTKERQKSECRRQKYKRGKGA
jgi:hypothetical protein